MKKLIFMGVLGLFLLGSCNSKSEHDHEGHSHETEKAHNHDYEGHDHEHEEHDHASENHEGHNHEAEMAAGHSDEIILAPEKAKAAGVESEIIQPKSFRQVITTSGQVQAAQGDESVVVANVAYLLTAWIILEPTWLQRICNAIIALLLLSLFITEGVPGAFTPMLSYLCGAIIILFLFPKISIRRFKQGMQ